MLHWDEHVKYEQNKCENCANTCPNRIMNKISNLCKHYRLCEMLNILKTTVEYTYFILKRVKLRKIAKYFGNCAQQQVKFL